MLARSVDLYIRFDSHPHFADAKLRAALRLAESICIHAVFWKKLLRIVEMSCPVYCSLLYVIAA